MDLLFKRYANPFLLLNQVISQKRLVDFIYELSEIKKEEDTFETWLKKYTILNDIQYHEYKAKVDEISKPKDESSNEQNLEAAFKNTFNILDSFKTSRGGEIK